MSTTRAQPTPGAFGLMRLLVRRELGQYFNTWSGYVIAAGLLAVTGLLYNVFAVGSTPRYSTDVLQDFFFFASGATLVAGLFFSMRLIAEERQAGTLPLLTTSSLTDGQIVVAKFASAMIFLTFYLVLTTYMPLLVIYHGKVSFGHLLSGYLGVWLFASTGVAIGTFGSTVARSQLLAIVIAAVLTVAMLLLWLTSRVVDGALGDALAYLTLHDKHFNPFKEGTITTANILFYVSVDAFFLMLARNVLESLRWRS